MFNRAKRDIQVIASRAKQGTSKEMCLAKNVTSSSAQKLQELSLQFRKQQAEYLRRACVRTVCTVSMSSSAHNCHRWLLVHAHLALAVEGSCVVHLAIVTNVARVCVCVCVCVCELS